MQHGFNILFFLQVLLSEKEKVKCVSTEKRKADDGEQIKDLKKVNIYILYIRMYLSRYMNTILYHEYKAFNFPGSHLAASTYFL